MTKPEFLQLARGDEVYVKPLFRQGLVVKVVGAARHIFVRNVGLVVDARPGDLRLVKKADPEEVKAAEAAAKATADAVIAKMKEGA